MLFSKMREATFTTSGYNNWKKAPEKLNHHEKCNTHQGAVMKWTMIKNTPPINEQLSTQHKRLQQSRQNAFIKQLSVLRYLLVKE